MLLEFTLQYWVLLGPAPIEVVCLGLLLLRSLTHACSGGGCCLRPATSEVADSHLVPQRSLVQAYSVSGGFLVPAPV